MKTASIRRKPAGIYRKRGGGFRNARNLALGGFAILLLASCVSTGEIDNPVTRRSTWADFIGGGDLRAACTPGAPPAYRFVYNADRAKQVRIYDLSVASDGGVLRTRVLSGEVKIDDASLSAGFLRLFNPEDTRTELAARNVDLIREALRADGVFAAPPKNERLLSEWHFWLLSACVDGRFQFDTRVDPSPQLETLAFPVALKAVDFSPVPYPGPPPERRRERYEVRTTEDFIFPHYELHIRDDGVRLGLTYGLQRP